MKIYVIIPTHNSEKTILSTLNSYMEVKAKSSVEMDLLIVDDNSTDDTLKIIHNMGMSSNLFTNVSTGVSEARNTALRYLFSKNEKDTWVTFLDSDDYLYSDFFGDISGEAKDFDYLVFEYQNYSMNESNFIDDNNAENKQSNITKINSELALNKLISNFGGSKYNFNSPWGRIIKLDFLKKNDILFERQLSYKEDFLFNLEILQKLPIMGVSNQVGYLHIINPDSVVNNYISNALVNEQFIQERLKHFNLTDKQIKFSKYNGWLGLQYVYVFPKNHVEDSVELRKKRFIEVFNYKKSFKLKDFYGKFYTKEFLFFILYKVKSFELLDRIFSFRG
ncbi:hypothetical protein FC71_GL000838 [Latilactobacillus sakei subsp. carnosus DSM 15831]|uniref:glycosyltransferase family 2 protein n=1 Tax=Latilactobacillus sakei TaxID=1599 RepID=UPI00019CEFAC|nr:glycosyltransferase family A protein [Latilactobacillus sakei]KRL70272.1 hypothetical protein FC71_GL000838 [Latilactobacillus sakei subsp. carnosus DSM 15831]GEP20909.1 hypothetical protein LSA03nite_04970 [Latilactobacillus sakei subsp. carnosus]